MIKSILVIGCAFLLSACSNVENKAGEKKIKNDSVDVSTVAKDFNPAEGMKEGDNEVFYKNGQLKMKGRVLDGKRHGIWTTWRENGLKWSENTYILGALEGKTVSFYPNGQIHYIGYYSNNVKSGKWTFFDENGGILKEEEYGGK